jgi:uncharacterized repeat protein (TIGR01451 family)
LLLLLAGAVFLLCGVPAAYADRVPANCTGSGLGITLYTSVPDVHIGDRLYYSVNVFNGVPGSGRVVCDATEIQAFIVTPDGLTNVVPLVRTTLHQGEADYYPDVVSYVVRAQDIQPDGTLLATAHDVGVIHQNDSNSSGGGFQGVNTEVNLPCVKITAFCVSSVGENGAIFFSGIVTNCGNNTLVGITVTNFHDAGYFTVLFPTNLARGQATAFSGTWVPVNPCLPSTAILTVRATDEFTATPRTVTNFTTVTCQNTLTAGLKVTKLCPPGPVSPGQLLTFSGSVSNTGNVTLTGIVVVNNQPAANTPVFTLASLAPGAVASFTGSYLAPTNCSVADTLTASASSRCGVAVTDTASATCPITTTPQIVVTAICPPTPVLAGGSITYSGTVRNTGNIPLNNIVLVSDRPAGNTTVLTVGTLAPGATTNFTATYTVPLNACTVTTAFSGRGSDSCTTTTVTNTISTTCPVTTAPAIAVTLACPTVSATTGGLITYTGTVRNSGNITLNNVTVVNSQSVPGTVLTLASLAPGATANFTATFTAPADACAVSSTVTATGNDLCTSAVVSNNASATCPLITTPSIVVTQNCPVSPATPGGVLTYTGTVRNAGNITLTNVVVLNNLTGVSPVFTVATLAPGASANFTGSYQAPTNCSSTSIATATARSICGVAVTGTVTTSCGIGTAPQIAVTAICPPTPVLPGGSITYSGTVRNTGNISLTNVAVFSDRPAANTMVLTVPTLAPGETTNFTGTYTVPTNVCSVPTTFWGVASNLCTSTSITNTVTTTCTVTTAPAIGVTLTCPVLPATTGGPITYTGTVRNLGNVTLDNVTVLSQQPGTNVTVLTLANLATGATANFTVSLTTPTDACSISSTVSAVGRDHCTALLVAVSASTTCPLITTPSLVVTKACPLQPADLGGMLVFGGTITNTGNVTLTNVLVINNQPVPNTLVFGPLTLAPGEGTNFTGSYPTPPDVCSVTDVLLASGNDQCTGGTVTNTASATCPLATAPAIVVTQSCPITPVGQGDVLTYSGTVSNSGNVTLTNIVVLNNWPIPNMLIFSAASLAPGAMTNFTGSYLVPLNCCVAWSTVKASGQDCYGATVTDTDSGTCAVLTSSQIVVTKICPPTAVRPGELLQYSGTVSNAGNIALINVTVMNNQPGPDAIIFGPVTLTPGESVAYQAAYIVPLDFCDPLTDTVTARGLNACTFVPAVNSVTTTCPILSTPRITVTKRCPPQPTPHGGELVFSGTVSNAGNVTLINVFVVNNQPSNNAPVIGPLTLLPGAFVNFSGSYIAPVLCCVISDTLTARGQDRCTGSNVFGTASAICPLLYTPGIAVVQACPATPVSIGGMFIFSGFVTNTGDAILTNVVVFSSAAGQNLPILGPINLAPGEAEPYSGSLLVPSNACSVSVTAISQETCAGTWITNLITCPIATSPQLVLTQSCPPNPVRLGDLLTYSGIVSNAGNLTLSNIFVFNSDPSNNLPVIGPITLTPLASAPFTYSYIAIGGVNPTTNLTIVTNGSTTITTNVSSLITTNNAATITTNPPTASTLATVNSVAGTTLDRFVMGTNFNGFTYAGEDHGYGATELYSMRQDISGTSYFDTIIPSTATTTDRFDASTRNFDSLAYAAPNLGYGPLLFYYLSHDMAGVSSFGSITPGGVVGVTSNHFVVGSNFDALAFTATDVGFGANLFYYLRHDASGLSTFGTINPALPGTVTDRFTVGTNFDALFFTDLVAPGYGPNNFYYLRHDANGLSTFGTIFVTSLTTATVTDRFTVGTNATDLTFTATDTGFGANLFYLVRGQSLSFATNIVTTFTTNTLTTLVTNTVFTFATNSLVTFTPTNTVTATGMDICQGSTVTAAVDCLGPIGAATLLSAPVRPFVPVIGKAALTKGLFTLSFPTKYGVSYVIQYKKSLSDPSWINLKTVVGTGDAFPFADVEAPDQPRRFYRVVSAP